MQDPRSKPSLAASSLCVADPLVVAGGLNTVIEGGALLINALPRSGTTCPSSFARLTSAANEVARRNRRLEPPLLVKRDLARDQLTDAVLVCCDLLVVFQNILTTIIDCVGIP